MNETVDERELAAIAARARPGEAQGPQRLSATMHANAWQVRQDSAADGPHSEGVTMNISSDTTIAKVIKRLSGQIARASSNGRFDEAAARLRGQLAELRERFDRAQAPVTAAAPGRGGRMADVIDFRNSRLR